MSRLNVLRDFLLRERLWVVLGVLYLAAWIIPFNWMKDWWRFDYSVLSAQPFILPIFLVVLWGRRKAFQAHLEARRAQERYTGRPTKSGSLTLLIAASLLYFTAHFSRLSIAGILGLVLMLLGIVVFVHGKSVLRVLLAPIFYLLLIVPWVPESAIDGIGVIGLRLNSLLVGGILTRLGNPCVITRELITVSGGSIPTPLGLYGMQGLFAALVCFWGYGLYNRYSAGRILGQILLAGTLAFLVHQLRFLVVCLLIGSNPALATRLGDANCWLFTLPSLALTFFATRLAARLKRPTWLGTLYQKLGNLSKAIQRPLDRVLFGSARAGTSVGKGILTIFTPLTWTVNLLVNGLGKLGGVFSASNKGLEALIRRGDRKRQSQRDKRKR